MRQQPAPRATDIGRVAEGRVAEGRVAEGRVAENRAAAYLERRGYRVVARNVCCRGGELDIVAYDGDVLCFVEVRKRTSTRYGTPAETVTPTKQARLTKAARFFLGQLAGPPPPCRFDVVTLTGAPVEIDLLKGAFEAAPEAAS